LGSTTDKIKNLYIPIEVKDRELISQLLLSFYAITEKNYRVYIGSKRAIHRVIANKKSKGGVYIYKGCHDKHYSKFIKEKCDAIFLIDQELSPNVENHDTLAKLRIIPDSIPYIDKYFVVNNIVKDSVLKAYPDLKGKVFVTGWPRIEVLSKKYIDIYKEDVDKISKKHGEYILFASDFGYLSEACKENRINQEFRQINSRPDLNPETDYIQKQISESFMRELEGAIQFLKELSRIKAVPKLIIRPHPSEDEEIWRRTFGKEENVLIESEGDIMHWILGSKALIHRGSTTAIQAYMAKIPSYYYVSDDTLVRKNISYTISSKVSSVSEFSDLFQRGWANNNDFDELVEKLSLQKNPCMEIISHMEGGRITAENPYSRKMIYSLKYMLIDFFQKHFPKSNKYNIQSERRKLGRFGILNDEVVRPILVFSNVLNVNFNPANVEKIENNLYQIQKK